MIPLTFCWGIHVKVLVWVKSDKILNRLFPHRQYAL